MPVSADTKIGGGELAILPVNAGRSGLKLFISRAVEDIIFHLLRNGFGHTDGVLRHGAQIGAGTIVRSEEHTSELQSQR